MRDQGYARTLMNSLISAHVLIIQYPIIVLYILFFIIVYLEWILIRYELEWKGQSVCAYAAGEATVVVCWN